MEQLNIDTGLRAFSVNGNGVLRFNPSDPNLYARFLDAAQTIAELEKEFTEQAGTEGNLSGEGAIRLMQQVDQRIKSLLGEVFVGNDFDLLLGGVNLLAVTFGGDRVLTNLLGALTPILEQGASEHLEQKVEDIQAKRKARAASHVVQ